MNTTKALFILFLLITTLNSCINPQSSTNIAKAEKVTAKEINNGIKYFKSSGYQPINPIPLTISANNPEDKKELLKKFPNDTMRLSIGEVTTSGKISFSSIQSGIENKDYVIILDYIKYRTDAVFFKYEIGNEKNSDKPNQKKNEKYLYYKIIPENVDISKNYGESKAYDSKYGEVGIIAMPVYIGIGLRMIANIHVNKSGVNLGNFMGLGLEAERNNIAGSLIIMTLGLSGEKISPIIPIPKSINSTSIQGVMETMAIIKSKLYESEVDISPQIIGLENYLNVDNLEEQIISELYTRKNYITKKILIKN